MAGSAAQASALAASTAPGVYATIADGRAGVAVGETFWAQGKIKGVSL